jgi:predicted MFS family arabinose efflux permease
MENTAARLNINEKLVVLLIASIQFINILDFMIVMPLGPDFARDIGIGSNQIGVLAGSYTAAAALAGLGGAFFLDRFDRRKALAVSILGLMVGTAAGGLAWDLPSMLGARILAGLFGGPATSLSLAIISDVVPAQRRGRAMGTVIAGFSVASIFGVPVSLELAHALSWRAPFFAVSGLGLAIIIAVFLLLPPLRIHLMRGITPPGWGMLRQLAKPLPLLAYGGTAAMMLSAFTLIPNIAPYIVFNLGYTGEAWLPGALDSIGIGYRPSGCRSWGG